jgi:hypothetical protein
VFVDGSLLESQLFHNGREAEYAEGALAWMQGKGLDVSVP